MLDRALKSSGADCVLHLYSDPIVGHLANSPPLAVPCVITVFYARWHYPWTYRTALLPRDAVRAFSLERAVRKWRSRSDALAVFSLDPASVDRWNRRSGAPAFWLPEPPVPELQDVETLDRQGCVLYGALAPRKGIDRLAAALGSDSSGLHAVLAGSVAPGYADELDRLLDRMRAGGATVVLRAWTHEESEGIEQIARARCAVLPYHRHCGMSRVLVEAAAAGTPLLVHDHGLIAALVRKYGIGLTADCGNAREFRFALRTLCADGEVDRYKPALRSFAARYDRVRFAAALLAAFGLESEPAAPVREAAG